MRRKTFFQSLNSNVLFVDTGGSGQVAFPFVHIPRDGMSGLVRQFRYVLKFACHESSNHDKIEIGVNSI